MVMSGFDARGAVTRAPEGGRAADGRAEAAPGDRQVQASAAPGELEAVRAFVNTLDIEQGTDDLATAAGFGRWLSGQGLLTTPVAVSATDLASAVTLREALRGVRREHAGHPGYPGLEAG